MTVKDNNSTFSTSNPDISPVMRQPRVLPLVLRIREQIDEVFAHYVGPISADLSEEEFNQWRTEGEVGPRGLQRYIARLSRYITQAPQREAFIAEASKRIQLSPGGNT